MTSTNSVHEGPIIAQKDNLQVMDCSICGYAHLYPLPDEEALFRLYEQDEFYNDAFLQTHLQEHQQGWWNSKARWYLHLLRNDGMPHLLDIGAGLGWLLKYWRQRYGQTGHGIEPSLRARNMAKGNGVGDLFISLHGYRQYCGEYFPPMGIDSVACLLLLEHVLDPKQFLREIAALGLGNEGKILLSVPNDINPLQASVKGDKSWFVQAPHVNYFTKQSFRALVESCGLEVVEEASTFPMEVFIHLGLDYRNNPQLGHKLHRFRLHFEKLLGINAYRIYQWLYRRYGIGRENIIVAQWR